MDDLKKLKEEIVVNQHQSEAAKRSGLDQYIRAHHVHARQWLPLEAAQAKVNPYSFSNSGAARIGFKVSMNRSRRIVSLDSCIRA
jgi:hypothetical protein